ncbi:hypothetical protein HID58_068497 [Brassica napus]|uniref:Uncharacterized protein n=1 Tax=Brassica napus TaxID=3708 RepID=A0ABQ7ZLP7_BRANA|nr:hypothetical protein HID58_068497 [Brassica napus]
MACLITIKLDSRFNKTIPSLMYVGDEKSGDDYEFVKALRMSGGDGAYSYSANSLLQRIFLWVEFRDPRFYPSSCESLPSIATIGDRSTNRGCKAGYVSGGAEGRYN